jgi:hypothetical protein
VTACAYGDEGHTSDAARLACFYCNPPPCEGDCCQRECDDCGWTLGPYDGDCPACGWTEDPL